MGKKKKIETKIFQQGKGRKTDELRSPLNGPANTNLDFYDKKTGKFVGRRKFGRDGTANKDLDKKHDSHGNKDHAHDYVEKKRGKERPLTAKEKREVDKATKKRRFWRNG